MKKKEKQRLYGLVFLFIVIAGAAYFGLIPGISLQAGFGDDHTDDIVSDYEVYAKITTRALLSKSTVDVAVNMYDENGNFIDTVTTSSGVGTFGMMLRVGSHVWLQARQAAPASADPYITPLTEWEVPTAGESADTVSLRNVETGESILWLRDVTSTAPTFTLRNGWDNASISDATQYYMNATDDSFKATVTLTVSNTYYGAEDFTDLETHKQYLGGVWLVLKTNNTHDFFDYDFIISDPSYVYYIWQLDADGLKYDANGVLADASVSVYISVLSGSTFTADSSMVFDIYDMIYVGSAGAPDSSADFYNGGSVDVTAITTVVDSA